VNSDIGADTVLALQSKNVPGDVLLQRLQSQKQQVSTFYKNNEVINAKQNCVENLFVFSDSENLKQIFPEKELSGLILNFQIHVSVNDLYVPTIFFFWGGGFFVIFFFVLYSALLHLPPLRFHCADGCWDRTQDRCN
jgi:hypothetical protein